MRTVKIAETYALRLPKLSVYGSFSLKKQNKQIVFYLPLSFYATCNVASNFRSRESGSMKDSGDVKDHKSR